jgi:hypothetical protein
MGGHSTIFSFEPVECEMTTADDDWGAAEHIFDIRYSGCLGSISKPVHLKR